MVQSMDENATLNSKNNYMECVHEWKAGIYKFQLQLDVYLVHLEDNEVQDLEIGVPLFAVSDLFVSSTQGQSGRNCQPDHLDLEVAL